MSTDREELVSRLKAAAGRDEDRDRSGLLWDAATELELEPYREAEYDLSIRQYKTRLTEAYTELNDVKTRLAAVEDGYEDDIMRVARLRADPLR